MGAKAPVQVALLRLKGLLFHDKGRVPRSSSKKGVVLDRRKIRTRDDACVFPMAVDCKAVSVAECYQPSNGRKGQYWLKNINCWNGIANP